MQPVDKWFRNYYENVLLSAKKRKGKCHQKKKEGKCFLNHKYKQSLNIYITKCSTINLSFY